MWNFMLEVIIIWYVDLFWFVLMVIRILVVCNIWDLLKKRVNILGVMWLLLNNWLGYLCKLMFIFENMVFLFLFCIR